MPKGEKLTTVGALQAELVAVRAIARARYEKLARAKARATYLLNQNHKLNDRIRALKKRVRDALSE